MRPTGETGVQTHFNAFTAYLRKTGVDVELVTPFSAPSWQVFPAFGMRKLIDPISGTASVWWYQHGHEYFLHKVLKKKLASGESGVIYAQCPLSARAALKTRVSNSQKVIMIVHFNLSLGDEWAQKGKIKYGGSFYHSLLKMEKDILAGLDGIVFCSDFMRKELSQRIPEINSVPFEIIPNFVSDPGEVPKNLPDLDLISIGSLEPRKNQSYLLDIIAATRDQGEPVQLTLCGDGPDRRMLEQKSRDLKIENYVRFSGFVTGAPQLMNQYKAYIHVARIENLPFVLIEALSRGVPIFAAPVGGISEVFKDGVEGRYLPLDDASEAARKILEWLSFPKKLSIASQAGRDRFFERFESSLTGKKLADFLLAQENSSKVY